MSYIDIALILILIWGGWRGFKHGFVYEVAVLGAWFLGLFAAFKLAYLFQPMAIKWFPQNAVAAHWVSFLMMFLSVSIGIIFLAKFFTGLVNVTPLAIVNKLFGATFSVLKTALILGVVIYLFFPLNAKYKWVDKKTVSDSILITPLHHFSEFILPVMTDARNDAMGYFNSKP